MLFFSMDFVLTSRFVDMLDIPTLFASLVMPTSVRTQPRSLGKFCATSGYYFFHETGLLTPLYLTS